MTKEPYNWWKDPKNAEEIKKLSWWDHPENQSEIKLPIGIVGDSNNQFTASTNDRTLEILGEHSHGVASGETKEQAIEALFSLIRWTHEFTHDKMLSYERWVPFRKGVWGKIGGTWFVVFGLHVYFRYGKSMKGGWYVPFTKLNVSVYSLWTTYKNYKAEKNGRTP